MTQVHDKRDYTVWV
ncbi:hypothetical protein CRE_09654 [Caenorhabditis remanei]|uniref:Uncharacterized protein n=1 Tax=Caenorhabditis remanei TaxID=31234 RepID=E3MX18_CAERE|nr:hypothetical protein CRE_09654 [Caenorhabditis remanei]